jgi:hypothetical protein
MDSGARIWLGFIRHWIGSMINRGARRLADCSGQMIWPKRGVYLVQPGAVSLAISTIPTTSTSNLGRDGRNRELARATAIAKGARACDFDGCQKAAAAERGDEAKLRPLAGKLSAQPPALPNFTKGSTPR